MKGNIKVKISIFNGKFGLKTKVFCLVLACVLLLLIPLSACSNSPKPTANLPQKLNDNRFGTMFQVGSKKYMIIGRGRVEDSHIIIPDTVYDVAVCGIGENAFQGDEKVISVKVPNTLTGFGNYCFYLCSNLEDINIPNDMEDIGVSAFHGCGKIKEIHLPKTLKYVRNNAFTNCFSLQTITYEGTLADWKRVLVGEDAFKNVKAKEIVCKDGIIPINVA